MGCRKLWREGIWRWRSAAVTLVRMAFRATHAWTDLIVCFIRGEGFQLTLARLLTAPGAISCALESLPGGSMRQQTKPFIVERKPSRKPKPDTTQPSIWGRLDADIAQGLKNQHDADPAAATGGDDRA